MQSLVILSTNKKYLSPLISKKIYFVILKDMAL